MPSFHAVIPRALPALIAGALLGACGQSAPPPQAPPPPAEVSVVTLKAQPVTLTRELPGRTSPFLVAEVRPQVSGIVQKRLFTEGSRVKAGQPLYQLDDAIPRADQETAKAALGRAQAALDAAKPRAARWAELVGSGYVSKQDNESTIAALRQAEADVTSAQAVLDRGNVILAHARITSPITGRIGKSAVTQGALVTANQAEALATVQQLDPIYVDVTQSSAELLELRKQVASGRLEAASNLQVAIVLEDGSRYRHEGKLTFTDVTVDPGTGSFLLRVEVPNPDDILLPGMYVRVRVEQAQVEHAILLPQQAVTRGTRGDSVMVVAADGSVAPRPVTVRGAQGQDWIVTDGLQPGEQVMVEGAMKLMLGAKVVKPVPWQPKSAVAPAGQAPAAPKSGASASPASAPASAASN